jgi:hypothetical protein
VSARASLLYAAMRRTPRGHKASSWGLCGAIRSPNRLGMVRTPRSDAQTTLSSRAPPGPTRAEPSRPQGPSSGSCAVGAWPVAWDTSSRASKGQLWLGEGPDSRCKDSKSDFPLGGAHGVSASVSIEESPSGVPPSETRALGVCVFVMSAIDRSHGPHCRGTLPKGTLP